MFEINKNAQSVRNNPVAQLRMPFVLKAAAQFLTADDTLEQAQLNKLQRICQKLDLAAFRCGAGNLAWRANSGCGATSGL